MFSARENRRNSNRSRDRFAQPSSTDHEELLLRELPVLRERARFLERNQAGADDLVQDTLEKALRSWGRFKPGSSVRAWLLRIMQNQFIDGWRHRRCIEESDLDQWPVAVAPPSPAEPQPLHLVLDLGDVKRVLPEVRAPLRQVFELAHLQRLCYREIGRRLEVPTVTVATRLHRARRQVRELLLARVGQGAA